MRCARRWRLKAEGSPRSADCHSGHISQPITKPFGYCSSAVIISMGAIHCRSHEHPRSFITFIRYKRTRSLMSTRSFLDVGYCFFWRFIDCVNSNGFLNYFPFVIFWQTFVCILLVRALSGWSVTTNMAILNANINSTLKGLYIQASFPTKKAELWNLVK